MKRKLIFTCAVIAFVTSLAGRANYAQQGAQKLKGFFIYRPASELTPDMVDRQVTSGTSIPMWKYTVTSPLDGNKYTGVMVGHGPSTKTTTSITTYLVPLVLRMPDGGVFNPDTVDTCLPSPGGTDLKIVQNSPIFRPANFTFGSVNVGDTQYTDAFQRANFWSTANGTNYHTHLKTTTLSAVSIKVPSGQGSTNAGLGCGDLGVINYYWFDPYVTGTVIPSLASKGVGPTSLVIFLLKDVVMALGGDSPYVNCCVLGYHGAFGSPTQTYTPVDFDTTGAFGSVAEDTTIMSHEVGEWMDDPLGTNATPPWGNVGQVVGCQNNLEVGDPLTGTQIPPITMSNGFTYHLQELAFFPWFFRTSSTSVNGWFSDNGTFTSAQGVCQ